VNAAMESLPEDLRMAITLREIEGLSYEDIAEAMQCPIGTVRSRNFSCPRGDRRASAARDRAQGWQALVSLRLSFVGDRK
jgi:RNA polymerase, sigma-24 subunit, RpoE